MFDINEDEPKKSENHLTPAQAAGIELLERIHDLLLINHIDQQRNYDLLFAIATGQSADAVSAMYEQHEAGKVFAPEPALEETDGS